MKKSCGFTPLEMQSKSNDSLRKRQRRFLSLTGFTILELLVVVIIVAILAGLAISNFTKTRERALDREAKVGLRLIQSGENMYRAKHNSYYPGSGSANQSSLNSSLQLSLSSTSWEYSIESSDASTFTAKADRGSNRRVWSITQDSAVEPQCTGSCY